MHINWSSIFKIAVLIIVLSFFFKNNGELIEVTHFFAKDKIFGWNDHESDSVWEFM